MKMKLKHEAQKGKRIKNQFNSIVHTVGNSYHYNMTRKKWELSILMNDFDDYSTHAPCKSIRAFRRKLKKMPKTEFDLHNKYRYHTVFGIGSNENK